LYRIRSGIIYSPCSTELVWAWFQEAQATGDSILAPVILLAEVASASSRGIGDPALAHQVVEQLHRSKII